MIVQVITVRLIQTQNHGNLRPADGAPTVGGEIWCSFLSTHAFLLGNEQTYATRGVPYYRVSRIFMSRNFMSRIFSVTENLAFSDGDSVTKPTKPKWRDSNSVVDMISSGGYDSPRRVTSHVHFRVNSVDDQSPTVVVYTHFQLINVVFTRKTLC